MPRVIIEVDGDLELLESLLKPAVDDWSIRLVGIYHTSTPPEGSIVEDWRNSSKLLNAFVERRSSRREVDGKGKDGRGKG